MNIHPHAVRRPGRRIAQLDPWLDVEVEPRAGYGCVEWYAYAQDGIAGDAPAPGTRPVTTPLPPIPMPEPPARTEH
jgi:hypothetical protein